MTTPAIFPSTVKVDPQGGMKSPYTRVLVYDTDGKGDTDDDGNAFATIQDALDYALDNGASESSRWLVRITGQTDISGAFNIWRGISVEGSGSANTRIMLTADPVAFYSGRSSLSRINLVANGITCALRVINDSGVGRGVLGPDLVVSVDYNTNAIVSAVELSGASVGISYARGGCYFYADNDNSGASAWAVGIRMLSGYASAFEAHSGLHIKTSCSGTGKSAALLRETASTNGYFHVIGDYGPVGDTTPIYRTYNSGGGRNIGKVNLASMDGYAVAYNVQDYDPDANADGAFMHQVYKTLQVRGAATLRGLWNAAVSVGAARLWRDASGNLRTKDSAPASDTDGMRIMVNPADAGYTNLNVYRSTSGVTTTGGTAATTVVFNTVTTDPRTEYNNTTGVWTASQAGTFLVQAAIYRSDTNTGRTSVYIFKNGAEHARFSYSKGNTEPVTALADRIMTLAASDTVEIRINTGTNATITEGTALTWLRIVRLF